MKKWLLTDGSSPSIKNKNNSQLLLLPLPSSLLLSVAPVASNNTDSDSNKSSLDGDPLTRLEISKQTISLTYVLMVK